MWCVQEVTPEYRERMEDVLELYERPLDEREPVVCLDEKPVQLLEDARASIPADEPGKIVKRDYEYVRKGTANVFCAVEPKAGRHLTKATKNRKGPEFAKMVARIARAYPDARTIHLVLDNLNTHREKSLTAFYGEAVGRRIWERFTTHYTPKHASWLDQAEIEIGVYSRQCLGRRRIGSLADLKAETKAWEARSNRVARKFDWKFTVSDARRKMGYRSLGRGAAAAGRRGPVAFWAAPSSLVARDAFSIATLLAPRLASKSTGQNADYEPVRTLGPFSCTRSTGPTPRPWERRAPRGTGRTRCSWASRQKYKLEPRARQVPGVSVCRFLLLNYRLVAESLPTSRTLSA
jgi:hypothetical protein